MYWYRNRIFWESWGTYLRVPKIISTKESGPKSLTENSYTPKPLPKKRGKKRPKEKEEKCQFLGQLKSWVVISCEELPRYLPAVPIMSIDFSLRETFGVIPPWKSPMKFLEERVNANLPPKRFMGCIILHAGIDGFFLRCQIWAFFAYCFFDLAFFLGKSSGV